MAKDYDRWKIEKLVTDVQVEEHGREITKLKENDAEKVNAIKDLQQRVTALENANNSGPASIEHRGKK